MEFYVQTSPEGVVAEKGGEGSCDWMYGHTTTNQTNEVLHQEPSKFEDDRYSVQINGEDVCYTLKQKGSKRKHVPEPDNIGREQITMWWEEVMESETKVKRLNETHGRSERRPLQRRQNFPEHLSENFVKMVLRKSDPCVVWARKLYHSGDLYSVRWPGGSIEVKAFSSSGPISFGPTKKFTVIYFLDATNRHTNRLIIYKLHATSEDIRSIRFTEEETFGDKVDKGNRPHIGWDKLYPLLMSTGKLSVIFDGTFESIFS